MPPSDMNRIRGEFQKVQEVFINMLAKRAHSSEKMPFMKKLIKQFNEVMYMEYAYLDQLVLIAEKDPKLQKPVLKVLQHVLDEAARSEKILGDSKRHDKNQANINARVRNITRRAPLAKHGSCIRHDRSTRKGDMRRLSGLIKEYNASIKKVIAINKQFVRDLGSKIPKNSFTAKAIQESIDMFKKGGISKEIVDIESRAPSAPACTVRERELYYENLIKDVKRAYDSIKFIYETLHNELKEKGKIHAF